MINTQESQWQDVVRWVDGMTDRLGMPVDAGIRMTVVALNVMGIHTVASCEGHLERGLPYPWVDIEAPESQALSTESARRLREAQTAPREQSGVLMQEASQVERQAKCLTVALVPRLVSLLHAFYQQHPFEYDRHLILDTHFWGGRIRLQSQGADFQHVVDEATKAQRLRAYREEMQAFAIFLKAEFFKEG